MTSQRFAEQTCCIIGFSATHDIGSTTSCRRAKMTLRRPQT